MYVKTVHNTDNLSEAKFKKYVAKAEIEFEESIKLTGKTSEIEKTSTDGVLTFTQLVKEWKTSVLQNLSRNYYGRICVTEKLFTSFLVEHHLADKPISEITVRHVQLFLNSFCSGEEIPSGLAKLKKPLPDTTNTDNQHIHLSFFENEPMRYNPQTKEYRYRWKGNIKKETFDLLKMDIEKHFLQPIEGIKRVRKLLTEEVKTVTKNCFDLSRSRDLKRLLRKLYEEIPYEGRIAYESENMNGCRDTVDAIVSFILTNGENAFAYKSITALIATRDKELLDLCLTHKIKNPEAYLYGGVFQRDLYRRMGNAVIKEVLKKRRDELIRAREIRHAKARQKYHLDSLTHCLLKSAEIAAYADQEAVDCFEEYRRKIELEDIKRKLREMEM